MTPQEEKLIRSANTKISKPIKLTLFETQHEKNKEFKKFCNKLSQLVPKIQVRKGHEDPQGAPMIGIGSGIRYQGIPKGTELEPFLEALSFNDQIFPAFYDVLTHDKWPVRLGAMVAMEEIISRSPALAARTLKPPWKRFDGVSDQIKGDVLYIFGGIGRPQTVP
jgi:hypothetical protein